ncbi:MAG TPA: gamma-glutamyl-gamma-aminobutyrate hydrolase family protein [Puia sp.]|uniref:gamma-glutamyl-gamma-aminobutyrate hydrolase family protein n=1 Tax=Puia sp. TaxID=2045100 RepID=UPI002C6CB1AA|nr:gamma-glutamyl-gamma-aminobutyrate hydrolase family protein [Puia sp.]HVU95000.1 gamma-glutamyl-gamma-aminobutyrate hydrolase family protein [Puia sp.]
MRLGLTYTGADWKHENYVRWLKAEDAGIEVVRLEVGAGPDVPAGLDGLVLSGGVDIAPSFYGGTDRYVKAPADGWQPVRDGFELSVLEEAWKRGLPVLGVCRGLQLINVARQGSLLQDLGVVGDEVHENVAGVDKVHGVVLEAGTLLEEVVGFAGEDGGGHRAFRGMVNSAHHQAVERLGADLRVNCRAEDGTIEGIEWEEPAGKPFLLAVQWHPERMFVNGVGDSVLYRAIRDRFMTEIKRNKK